MQPLKSSVRQSIDVGLRQYMLSIYQYMGLGLALTGVVALGLALMPAHMQRAIMGLSFVSMIGTFGIAIYFSMAFQRMSSSTAQGLFWLYAALMGMMLTTIFQIYHAESIAKVFFITAGTFGAASVYGHSTQRDLTSMGAFVRMGLFGLIIASLVNFFIQSSAFDFALSVIGVFVFVGLTAYDTQRLKQIYNTLPHDEEIRGKIAIFGALTLYLDVVNLFLSLLRLFGDRK
jgi:FtsH-binding integral membrane protein